MIRRGAFEPIIGEDLFERAQKRFADFPFRLTDEDLLDRLKLVLKTHGKLTRNLVRQAAYCPSESTYRQRFGNLLSLFSKIGFPNPEYLASSTCKQRLMILRREFIRDVLAQFPSQFSQVRRNYRFRALLKYRRTGLLISILIVSHVQTIAGRPRWLVIPPKNEPKRLTILVLLNKDNTRIQHLRIFPKIRIHGKVAQIAADSEWMRPIEFRIP